MMAKNILIVVIGLILIALVYTWWNEFRIASALKVNSYEECVAMGYPVMESYPMQCRTPDGRTFVSPVEPTIY